LREIRKLSLRATKGSEAPASPRHMQLLQSRGRGGAISFFALGNPDCFARPGWGGPGSLRSPGLARRSRGGARNDKSRLFPHPARTPPPPG
jgi:hypothetical protein